jgi:hypothetical protein
MSHEVHEVGEHAQHEAAHSGQNKRTALLIALLALCLALNEMQAKGANSAGIAANIQASDLWNFFQAKSIRQATLKTAIEASRVSGLPETPELAKQRADWQATIDRLESDTATNEGRRELAARATALEHERDRQLEREHGFEIASLMFQLGIVLASIYLLTTNRPFLYGAIVLGVVGAILGLGVAFELPYAMNLVHHHG